MRILFAILVVGCSAPATAPSAPPMAPPATVAPPAAPAPSTPPAPATHAGLAYPHARTGDDDPDKKAGHRPYSFQQRRNKKI